VTTNSPALAVAEQADRLIKEMSAHIGSANEFTFLAEESAHPQNPPRSYALSNQTSPKREI
jgi:hypothetical protein